MIVKVPIKSYGIELENEEQGKLELAWEVCRLILNQMEQHNCTELNVLGSDEPIRYEKLYNIADDLYRLIDVVEMC